MNYEFLKAKPFYLSNDDVKWVDDTLKGLSLEEKVGQLFCLTAFITTDESLDDTFKVMSPGGIMFRPMPAAECVEFNRKLAERSKLPLLVAANLEKGGNGIAADGTMINSPMGVAACDDPSMGEKWALICAREGAAAGANWAFAPIIDIDYNFRNPITNTRTLGSNPETVTSLGAAYVRTVQKLGVAASIKHFPGDGRDERDQHLVTSVNDFSCEEWNDTYGKAYKTCIDEGALTCMIGHILQPAWQKRLNPSLKDEELLPASLSTELMNGLLREKLGFNGLIVTDATTMAGFTIPMKRKDAVPRSIAAGADMFLFTRNMKEDFDFMLEGVKNGVITAERLNEAVTRILALKAALKLHTNKPLPTAEEADKIVGCDEHKAWARESADKCVTLVKEESGVLPVTPDKYPRILYFPIESEQGFAYSVKAGVCDHFKQMLIDEGFQVETFVPGFGKEGNVVAANYYEENFDAMIYLANIGTKSNQTTVRIEWQQPMGANCPHYLNAVPNVFISVENPYHLLDVPRIKTFINAYSSTDEALEAVMSKLTGKSAFTGKSPVDAFCGKWDTRL